LCHSYVSTTSQTARMPWCGSGALQLPEKCRIPERRKTSGGGVPIEPVANREGIPMSGAVARKLFGAANERRIRSYRPRVEEINALEPELEKLSNDELRERTAKFKAQVAEGTSLDDILVEAFATVR